MQNITKVQQFLSWLDTHSGKIATLLLAVVSYLEAHPVVTDAHPTVAKVVAVGVLVLAQAAGVFKWLDGKSKYEVGNLYSPPAAK